MPSRDRGRELRRALWDPRALRATRELLAEASRIHERTRIARELHDVIGHERRAPFIAQEPRRQGLLVRGDT